MKVDFALSHHEAVESAWWEANPNGTEAQFEAFLAEEIEAAQWDAAMAQMKRAEAEFNYAYFA